MNDNYHIFRERLAGMLTVGAMIAAFTIANTPLFEFYWLVHHIPVSIQIGEFGIDKPLIVWINKGLMVFFFLLIGLEIKHAIWEGQLSGPKQLALPALAAMGGMAVPAIIYIMFNVSDPVAMRGWAIPTATDIVLALAVLSLFRGRVAETLMIFLAALAIFDDVGAILIIALFYSEGLSTSSLLAAAVGIIILICLNRIKVVQTAPYVLIGIFIWVAVMKSGVHATLVGVIVAFAIPLRAKRNDVVCSPCREIESQLRSWVMLGIVPIFAFFNAGISLNSLTLDRLWSPAVLGIVLGLFIGKQLGVFGTVWLAVQLGLGRLPEGVTWKEMYGISLLAGIGFTMSLFITSLAFTGNILITETRFAIIIGSLISAVAGLFVLFNTVKERS